MDAVKLIGTVKKVTVKTGEGQKGAWKSVGLAVEENEGAYPSGANIDYYVNDTCKEVESVKEGDIVECLFNLTLNEWKDKFFTNTRGWKVKIIKGSNVEPQPQQQPQHEDDDDLPF